MSRVDVVTICIYTCMYLMLLLLWVDRGSVGGKGVSMELCQGLHCRGLLYAE